MIKNILKHKTNRDENGAAMIFALILVIMLVSVSIFVASAATTQSRTTATQTVREALNDAASDGLEWAFSVINSDEPYRSITPSIDAIPKNNPYISPRATVSGLENVRYKVWAEKVVTQNNVLSYYIYSEAYSEIRGVTKSVVVRAIVEGLAVDKSQFNKGDAASNLPDTMSYTLLPEGAFSQGMFATSKINVNNGARIYSHNSLLDSNNPTGTKPSTVSTNGAVEIGSTTSGLSQILGGIQGAGTGCLPATICSQTGAPNVNYRNVNVVLDTVQLKNAYCPAASYPNWSSSANSGLLTPGTGTTSTSGGNIMCVGNLNLDTTTTVAGSFTTARPLIVVVTGAISVTNGAQVNWGSSPLRLEVISTGGDFTVPNASNPRLSMMVAGAGACNIGTTTSGGNATYFGSLACNNITMRSTARVFIDTAVYGGVGGAGASGFIWFEVYREEVSDNS